jgi:hypothetical protein
MIFFTQGKVGAFGLEKQILEITTLVAHDEKHTVTFCYDFD